MYRYHKFNYLSQNFQLSKNNLYEIKGLISVKKVLVEVGHLKPNNSYPEHGLLMAELSSQTPKTSLVKHGKRLRNTIILTSTISSKNKWTFLDKLLNIVAPLISDLQEVKVARQSKLSTLYKWRWRHFFEWTDVDPLLTDRVMRKDIYLPLFINIELTNIATNAYHRESVLRMFRLPFKFYKIRSTI